MAPQLIIFDVYGTLLKSDASEDDFVVRAGFQELISAYPHAKKVAFSDANTRRVTRDLIQAGIYGAFSNVYDEHHCIREVAYSITDPRFRKLVMDMRGGEIKDLTTVCEREGVAKKDTVFIGDNFHGHERKAAQIHEVRYVQVPQFRNRVPIPDERDEHVQYETPPKFTFTSLIGTL